MWFPFVILNEVMGNGGCFGRDWREPSLALEETGFSSCNWDRNRGSIDTSAGMLCCSNLPGNP